MTESTESIDSFEIAVARFTDDDAREWEVREIRNPLLSDGRGFFRHPEFAEGWLLFMSGEERRRYAPFPTNWRAADAIQLKEWCSAALTRPAK